MPFVPLSRLLLTLALAPSPAVEPETETEPDSTPAPALLEVPVADPGQSTEPEPLGSRSVGYLNTADLAAGHSSDTLARLSTHAPSLHSRSLGGLGRFGALSPRWHGEHQVFLDGAPSQVGIFGPIDFPTRLDDGISQIEVHRSHAPLRYGAHAIAGVLDIVGQLHRGAPRIWAGLGFGSNLTRAAQAGFALALRPRLSLTARVEYEGSRGDFVYFDDVATPLLFGDDALRRRASNRFDGGLAQLRLDHANADLQASSQLFARWRVQGVPGPPGALPSGANLASFSIRNISRVRRSVVGPGGYVEWVGSLSGDYRRYRDREASYGIASDDERIASVDAWVSPRVRLPAWRQGWVAISAELRGQWVDVRDRSSALDPAQFSTGEAQRSRLIAGMGAQIEQWLYKRRWSIAPMIHVNVASNSFALVEGEGEPEDRGTNSTVLGFSPRLASKFEFIEGLELRGSVGRYLRLPELSELFGDRGYAKGNEGLRAESGTRVDGGLTLELPQLGRLPLSLSSHIVGFVTWSRDRIQWIQEDSVARPINIARARLRGLEFGTGLDALDGDLVLDLSYVLLDSANGSEGYTRDSAPIPGQARHHLRLRPAGGHRFAPRGGLQASLEPRFFYELEWLSSNTLDLDGFDELPARVLHALGASLRVADRIEFGVEARGLGNPRSTIVNDDGDWPGPYPVAASDVLGIPLPGPSVWATLRLDLRLAPPPAAKP